MNTPNVFLEVLENHKNEKHVAVLHSFPDPDAIASAYAHRLISSEYGIEVTILYTGKISHQQNIALVKVLGIELVPYDENYNLNQFQGAIFIDHQGTTVEEVVSGLEAAHVPVLLIVDHHEPQERVQADCVDIQQVGATSTIYAQYIEQGNLDWNKSRKDHVVAATALMHGLLTDTRSFITAGPEDFKAAAFLSRLRDPDLLA
ncbi:MAG: DHH family phosphoesterase, partial [Omnitrophica WOR_2 bacterium]